MLIDWFTVAAQALNFLILVWLMKRFLYQPIVQAVDAREQRIAQALAQAQAQTAQARQEGELLLQQRQAFEQQRAALLGQAEQEAQAQGQRLMEAARQAADALAARRQEALRNDARHLNQALSRRARQEVFAITRQTLADLAGACLEERMGEVFIRRLREMAPPARATLAQAFKSASGPALLRSTFELPAAQRAAIEKALGETLSVAVRLNFETTPELVSGVELSVDGQKLAWSIADYLASLEQGVAELLGDAVSLPIPPSPALAAAQPAARQP